MQCAHIPSSRVKRGKWRLLEWIHRVERSIVFQLGQGVQIQPCGMPCGDKRCMTWADLTTSRHIIPCRHEQRLQPRLPFTSFTGFHRPSLSPIPIPPLTQVSEESPQPRHGEVHRATVFQWPSSSCCSTPQWALRGHEIPISSTIWNHYLQYG